MSENMQVTGQFHELYDRAMCLGYTSDSAARMADCAVNYANSLDACAKHPGHSTTHDNQGYAVDMCEACKVIELTDAQGWYAGKWADIEAKMIAEHVEILTRDILAGQRAGQCVCGLIMELGAKYIPAGGTCCLGCGSVFTLEGAELAGRVAAVSCMALAGKNAGIVRAAECETGQCGECADCFLTAMVPEETVTDVFAQGMAEAERDDAAEVFAASRAAIVEADNDDTASTNEQFGERTGIEILRELLTLPSVPAKRVKVVHLGAFNGRTASGRMITESTRFTARVEEVTCKCCPKTSRYLSTKTRAERATQAARWAAAGIHTSMVVRQVTTGRLGCVTSLDSRVAVGYWTGDERGNTYDTAESFDASNYRVQARDLVGLGDVVVSSLGQTATVSEVKPDVITMVRDNGTLAVYGLGEFAAELSRGYIAVVPTGTQAVPSATLRGLVGHSTPVTMADLMEDGLRLNNGYGSSDNGVVVSWHPGACKVKRDNGTVYSLTFERLVKLINGGMSTYVPDAQGRAIGSWR